MEIEVYNINGSKTAKKVTLDDAIFSVEPNDHAIYLDVKAYMNKHRQGTHSSKEKSQVSGSTRKIKKQKGTGGARAGSIKNPLFVGGARVFGPHPRVYDIKLNKKLKRIARKSALSYKAKENKILVLEDFTFETPQTKKYIEILNNFNLSNKKTLLVLSESNKIVYLSSRNLEKTNVASASDLNTYDILNAQNLIFVESAISEISKVFNKSEEK